MATWSSVWPAIQEVVRYADSRDTAIAGATVVLGKSVTWEALQRAYKRYAGVGILEHLGATPMSPATFNQHLIELTGWEPSAEGPDDFEEAAVVPPIAQLKLPVQGGNSSKPRRHLFIPDTQVEPGVPINHFRALGRFVADKGIDVVVWGGDIRDFPSLSEYENPKAKVAAGRCKLDDVRCGNEALSLYQNELVKAGFEPEETHVVYGNHDCRGPLGRPGRYMAKNPEDAALFASVEHVEDSFGWHQHEFLQPVIVDGVAYCHLFPFNTQGKQTQPAMKFGARDAATQVKSVMGSATAGHQPGLSVAIHQTPFTSYRGLIAGSFYQHTHSYNGHARYWQGVVVKHQVKDGWYDMMEVSLDFLLRRYGD